MRPLFLASDSSCADAGHYDRGAATECQREPQSRDVHTVIPGGRRSLAASCELRCKAPAAQRNVVTEEATHLTTKRRCTRRLAAVLVRVRRDRLAVYDSDGQTVSVTITPTVACAGTTARSSLVVQGRRTEQVGGEGVNRMALMDCEDNVQEIRECTGCDGRPHLAPCGPRTAGKHVACPAPNYASRRGGLADTHARSEWEASAVSTRVRVRAFARSEHRGARAQTTCVACLSSVRRADRPAETPPFSQADFALTFPFAAPVPSILRLASADIPALLCTNSL